MIRSDVIEVVVYGSSMQPCLCESDKVLVLKQATYQSGDILAFRNENDLIIHRLLAKYNSFFICKGDNSFALEKIAPNQVLGKAIKVERNGTLVTIPNVGKDFFRLSIAINRIYCDSSYNVAKTMESEEYQIFFKKYLSTSYDTEETSCLKSERYMLN